MRLWVRHRRISSATADSRLDVEAGSRYPCGMSTQRIRSRIDSSLDTLARLGGQIDLIHAMREQLAAMFAAGGTLYTCGNGGSAADSQHIAAELVGRFKRERRALAAIALTTDSSILTSLANDYSFERVFSRQVEALGYPGDLLILISTSGNSANLIEAARAAKDGEIGTMALLGRDGGKVVGEVDFSIIVPSFDTARIQEGHMLIYHIICDLVEEEMAG